MSSRDKGFVFLWRDLADSDLWLGETFSRGQAWVDLLIRASWKDRDAMIQGGVVHIRTGELISSERALMDRWRWSKDKLRRFLAQLERLDMITTDRGPRGTRIMIAHYSAYQRADRTQTGLNVEDMRASGFSPTTDQIADQTADQTAGRPRADRKSATYKKKEEIRNKECVAKLTLGPYQNVMLMADELEQLRKEFPGLVDSKIERLSVYLATSGRRYANHAAVLRDWLSADMEKTPKEEKNMEGFFDEFL